MDKHIKLIFLSDTHLGFDFPIRPRIKRRRRGDDFIDNFKRVLKYTVKTRADGVIHGGDVFFRCRVPKQIIELVYSILLNFSQYNIPIFLVPGNHERSRLPSPELLDDPNIRVFDKPRSFTLDGNIRLQISGFPYHRNSIRSQIGDVIGELQNDQIAVDFRVLCMHQLIEGARIGPSNYMFRHASDVIRVEDLLAEFPLILSGHIHRRQLLVKNGEKRENSQIVVFSGSTERTSFAEKDEPKGFFEFVIGKNRNNQTHVQDYKFIELPSRPMIDLTLTASSSRKKLKQQILSSICQFDRNAIVRLKAEDVINTDMAKWLSAPFLREIFPDTMNFQLSRNLYIQR